MTLQSTKDHLIQLLDEKQNNVIALSGKWGTGKSFLWQQVKNESADSNVKNSLYVSLFGVADINAFKLKIVQSAIPTLGSHSGLAEKVKIGVEGARNFLQSIHKGFSALDQLALLAVPTILKDRVIVIDDIERKHEKLNADEILGFIDEFTQLHGARIILILNSDQLSDKSVWDKMREKVIDQEVRLDTSCAEAFDIAIELTSSNVGEHIKPTVEICGLTNIRIIRKVIRAVNRILNGRELLAPAVLHRVIPSTVLLAATHYKGLEEGPDFKYILSVGNRSPLRRSREEVDENIVRHARWDKLLQELHIRGCDEYEHLVVEYLQSGLFDNDALAKIIDRYIAEEEALKVGQRIQAFHEKIFWHHWLSEDELMAEARALAPHVHWLNANAMSFLHDCVCALFDGKEFGDAMLNDWLSQFTPCAADDLGLHDFVYESLHPAIQAKIDSARDHVHDQTTLYDACEHILNHHGWGDRQKVVMARATAEDFESMIRNLNDPKKLRVFMAQMIEMCEQPGAYRTDFGSAIDNFIAACRKICTDPNSIRLKRLIQMLFDEAKLKSELGSEVSAAK